MKTGHVLSAVAAVTLAAGSAQAMTIATFADPTTGPVPSLFQWNATTNTLTGGWSGTGLTLQTPGSSFPDLTNATFTLTPMVAVFNMFGVVGFGAGAVQFFDSAANPVFRIEFDNAQMSSALSFGASDFVGFNVRFSGTLLDFPTQNEAFAFSFANPTLMGNGGFTVTSSFTSSADRIPAPGALALVGAGGLLLARRRRA
jgi:MYXO-CTERM domain-containing protein